MHKASFSASFNPLQADQDVLSIPINPADPDVQGHDSTFDRTRAKMGLPQLMYSPSIQRVLSLISKADSLSERVSTIVATKRQHDALYDAGIYNNKFRACDAQITVRHSLWVNPRTLKDNTEPIFLWSISATVTLSADDGDAPEIVAVALKLPREIFNDEPFVQFYFAPRAGVTGHGFLEPKSRFLSGPHELQLQVTCGISRDEIIRANSGQIESTLRLPVVFEVTPRLPREGRVYSPTRALRLLLNRLAPSSFGTTAKVVQDILTVEVAKNTLISALGSRAVGSGDLRLDSRCLEILNEAEAARAAAEAQLMRQCDRAPRAAPAPAPAQMFSFQNATFSQMLNYLPTLLTAARSVLALHDFKINLPSTGVPPSFSVACDTLSQNAFTFPLRKAPRRAFGADPVALEVQADELLQRVQKRLRFVDFLRQVGDNPSAMIARDVTATIRDATLWKGEEGNFFEAATRSETFSGPAIDEGIAKYVRSDLPENRFFAEAGTEGGA